MMDFPAPPMTSIRTLYPQVASLLVFQKVFDHPVGQAYLSLLQRLASDQSAQSTNMEATTQCLKSYGLFFRELAIADLSWHDWLVDRIVHDDNPFSKQAQRQPLAEINAALKDAVLHDLSILQQVYGCGPDVLGHWVQVATQVSTDLVPWESNGDRPRNHFLHEDKPWTKQLETLAGHYHQYGSGQFSRYRAFRWVNGELQDIVDPECLALDDIVAYDKPKHDLVQNTECLIAGLPALNVLLYGSRGSGKSSLVKALLTEYHDRGLRLVEVDKTGFHDLPAIVELLRHQPQKFIIFIDDLSFEEDDEVFKSLKVVLEGSIRAKAQNVVVYATSNRRHLVREFFEERPRPSNASEIHQWDTVQEKLSFSDRFGMTLTFTPANQDTYLEIVHHLARCATLDMDRETLEVRARQWATRNNGRSGRTARQFIDFLIGEQSLNFTN